MRHYLVNCLRNNIAILLLLFTVQPAFAQSWQWGETNAGGGIDAWPIATDNSGNVYCAGISFTGNVTFGSTTITFPTLFNAGDEQGIIVKYSNSGTVLWAKGFQTPLNGWSQPVSMAVDPSGNLIVLGIFNGTISMDAFTLTSAYTNQYFLMKISPSGTVLWMIGSGEAGTFYGDFTTVNGGNYFVLTWGAVACDNTGNIFITGNFTGTTTIGSATLTSASFTGDNVFVAEYTTAGTNVWAAGFGGSGDDNAFGITVSSTGNVYLSGAFTSPSMTIGPNTLTNSFGYQDAFIAEYSSSGTPLWGEAAGGLNGAYGAGLTSDVSGNVYLTGAFGDPSITFGSTTINAIYPASNHLEVFLIQINSANAITWSKAIGTPTYDMMGYCIALASCGQVWVSGSWAVIPFAGGFVNDSANIDGNMLYTPDSSVDPVFIAGYNLAGGVVGYGALMSGADDQNGIACDPTGNIFICADYWNEDFTNFIIGPDTLFGNPTYNPAEYFYIGKYTNVIGGPDTIKRVTDTALCSAVGIQLTAPPGYYAPFLWSNGDTTMSVTIDSSGTYWLECPGGCNTSYLFDTFHVSINGQDTLHNSKDTGLCSGNIAILSAPAGYLTYNWNTGASGTSSVSISAAGTYWVSCFDSCAMQPLIDTFHVTINLRDSSYLHTDTSICSQLGITLNGPNGFLSYQWSNGDTTSSVTLPSGSGTAVLWVACNDSCNQPYTIDTFHVTYDSIDLNFSLGKDTFACSPVLLTVPLTGVTYLWQNGSPDQSYIATGSGLYYCKVSELGCTFSDSINVNISSEYPYNFDTNVCLENSFYITLNAYVPQGSHVSWNTGAQSSSIIAVDTGTYLAYVSDSACTTTDTMHITGQYCNCWCWLPNAFTPHGKINTGFIPIIDPYCTPVEYTFTIFDRWGKIVFTTNDPTVAWDGTYEGVPAELDVYMFQVTFWGGMQHKKFFYKGDVTLVR